MGDGLWRCRRRATVAPLRPSSLPLLPSALLPEGEASVSAAASQERARECRLEERFSSVPWCWWCWWLCCCTWDAVAAASAIARWFCWAAAAAMTSSRLAWWVRLASSYRAWARSRATLRIED